ncbi:MULTISPECIES: NnrU family protein [unclassified Oleiphilus]|uniref:NnrU family protein n=1 Tax=unclassified Oleiphilus TaxID=2631174 RepID=UPI0007C30DEE|nr:MULTISPECIES: NnrU family protein [unclassified Oleiphilus]KZY45064.1 hypothetical protein A3732_11185 [Oleiphilus sp. HI0050]KZY72876.1 hypothetical protein A3740_03840 [Oleiphilus sp. HI0068]KZY77719.1 hypothetical protein A3741_09310 [Oleiphilus sp. HI0069]KZY89455.1 hypothetical protein A3743_00915 [Oleiphilus sp. HI0072]KZZ12194.1 hypothetical protein A3749_06970 [Oleiphilus sp. HI0078]KZZ44387.1 hypothetical protein A3755_03310 [Oleiphilus sp. HI0085]
MTTLLIGLIIFIGIHLLPTLPELRQKYIDKLGELPYKGIFAVISIAGFALIIMGKADAPFISIWQPPQFLSHLTKLLMLPAFILLVAAYIPSNIKRRVRHPMLAGVKLWALGHLLINGDAASILLFGGFLAYAVIDMIRANKRSEWVKPEPKPAYMTFVVIGVGVIAYGAVAMHHMQLFGVPLF